jgi:7-cyano-7-deazaguanine synthase
VREKSVVLLSGGIDSSTVLAIAKAERHELYALSFDYNQRHKRELASASRVASSFEVKNHLCIKFDLREIGGSALTSEIEVPKTRGKDELGRMKNEHNNKNNPSPFILPPSSLIPVTYVPARNTIFLSFALAWAEVLEAENIFIGANAVDYSGYPDCRPEYLKAFEDMANLATKASVEGKIRFKIQAPLVAMKKSEIIRTGRKHGLDYSLTWSCYDPQAALSPSSAISRGEKKETDNAGLVPCGKCDSCIFRAKGFQEAGLEDPLINSMKTSGLSY